MLTNGTVLHGRYRIAREIGHGGMGAVYEAIDARLQNTVAVKECRLPGVDADRAFEREAKLLAALRHPALPVVIDYFVEGEAQFLVMQFIEGDDLGKLLDHRRSRFPPAEVVVWAGTVLDALSYLHDHEPPVVHRDIKPANLKRTPRGEIVLLDFGLAKGRPEDAATPPPDRSVFGYTLAYAPLEQILGKKTDARSDVYAVGATLYHLLTGYPPANARDRSRAVASGMPDPLPAAHLVRADIPESLGRLIARAMALDGADRYASARSMRAALNECGVDQTTHVSTPDHDGASRRIDVAAPSRAEVGRQIDLLVQVRFETSTRLGLEDWPSKARPDEIEQVSEPLQLAYPTDPQTGRFLPARLRIKVVAPDFRVDGQADRLIEVPPDEYSKRLAFLLTPLRAGSCRVNVEVYGLDDLFLGAVPVEIVAVAGAVSEQEIGVGNLVLEVVARQVAALLLGARIAAAPSPAPLAAADAGSGAITMPTSSVPIVEGAASQIAAAAGASARSPDTQTYGRLTGRGDEAEPSPKSWLSRVARVTGPLAVVVFAVAVLLTIRGGRETPEPSQTESVAAPSTQGSAISAPATAPPAAAPAAAGNPPAGAPAPVETAPVATATPGSSAPAKTSPVTVTPGSSAATKTAPETAKREEARPMPPPDPAPSALAPRPNSPGGMKPAPYAVMPRTPDVTSAPPAAVRPPPVTVAVGESLSSVNAPGVKLTIRSIERLRDGRVRLGLLFVNESAESARVGLEHSSTVARGERGTNYQVTAAASGAARNPNPISTATLQPGERFEHEIEIRPLDARVEMVFIALGQPMTPGDLARFAPFVVMLPVAGVR